MRSSPRRTVVSLLMLITMALSWPAPNAAWGQGPRAPGGNTGSKNDKKEREQPRKEPQRKESQRKDPPRKDPPREAPRRESSSKDNSSRNNSSRNERQSSSPPNMREGNGGTLKSGNDVARQRQEMENQRKQEAAQERQREKEQGLGQGNVNGVPPAGGGGVPAAAGGNGTVNGVASGDAQAFREQAEATVRAQRAIEEQLRLQRLEADRDRLRNRSRSTRIINNNPVGGLPAVNPGQPVDANPVGKDPPPKRAPRPAAEQPVALSDEEIKKLIEQLGSGDQALEIAALTQLAKALPQRDRDDVAKAIEPHLDRGDVNKRRLAGRALGVWATKDFVPQLREFLVEVPRGVDPDEDVDRPTRVAVLQALGEIKDPNTIELIGERLVVPADRTAAAKALKEFGPPAEEVALKYLDDEDKWVRASVADVLAKVGTDTSVDPLTQVAKNDADDYVRSRAQAALKAVEDR